MLQGNQTKYKNGKDSDELTGRIIMKRKFYIIHVLILKLNYPSHYSLVLKSKRAYSCCNFERCYFDARIL